MSEAPRGFSAVHARHAHRVNVDVDVAVAVAGGCARARHLEQPCTCTRSQAGTSGIRTLKSGGRSPSPMSLFADVLSHLLDRTHLSHSLCFSFFSLSSLSFFPPLSPPPSLHSPSPSPSPSSFPSRLDPSLFSLDSLALSSHPSPLSSAPLSSKPTGPVTRLHPSNSDKLPLQTLCNNLCFDKSTANLFPVAHPLSRKIWRGVQKGIIIKHSVRPLAEDP